MVLRHRIRSITKGNHWSDLNKDKRGAESAHTVTSIYLRTLGTRVSHRFPSSAAQSFPFKEISMSPENRTSTTNSLIHRYRCINALRFFQFISKIKKVARFIDTKSEQMYIRKVGIGDVILNKILSVFYALLITCILTHWIHCLH